MRPDATPSLLWSFYGQPLPRAFQRTGQQSIFPCGAHRTHAHLHARDRHYHHARTIAGSYWLAGAVAATFAFSMALLAPQISRAVDRLGQRRVLPCVTVVSVAGMLSLLLCTHYQAPDWTLFVFAAVSGCMPSMPAMVRARWTEILRGTPRLHTAFSFESVLDEVCFIIGPPFQWASA